MSDYSTSIVAPLARWASRIALFSVALLLSGVVLHRLAHFPTTVAMNLFLVGYAGAGLAMAVGLIALVQIWRTGFAGAALATLGVLLPLVALAGPMFYFAAYFDLPRINDVTTDLSSPPPFVALAKRTDGANPSAYPGKQFSEQQAKAYPDLRTVVMDRPVDETFELVEEVVRKLRWHVAAAEPPVGRSVKTGTIEATDRTLLVGFTDDVIVRVEGSPIRARVDVRSASRYGRFDFGQNAARVRRFVAELHARAEATAPGATSRRALTSARARALLKRQKAGDPRKAASRNVRAPDQSNAQRGPAQKERQR
jgi:uncharacterized protein (DUF1499 family)